MEKPQSFGQTKFWGFLISRVVNWFVLKVFKFWFLGNNTLLPEFTKVGFVVAENIPFACTYKKLWNVKNKELSNELRSNN